MLFFILLSIVGLFKVPSIQTKALDWSNNYLSEYLETTVNIQELNYSLLNYFELNGIYIEDQQTDTLLFAENVSVNIGVFALFRGQIDISSVEIQHADVNILKDSNNVINFQFIIDQINQKKSSQNQIVLNLEDIQLEDIQFHYDDYYVNQRLAAKVNSLAIEVDSISLLDRRIVLKQLLVDKIAVAYQKLETPDSLAVTTKSYRLYAISRMDN